MLKLSLFKKQDQDTVLNMAVDFFNRFLPKTVLRKYSVFKAADDATDEDIEYRQLLLTDIDETNAEEEINTENNASPKGNGIVSYSNINDIPNWIGIPAQQILLEKVMLGFFSTSFFEINRSGVNTPFFNYRKDTWYRFDTMHANWEGLQLDVAENVINTIVDNVDCSKHTGSLAIDDSLYSRTTGVHGGKSKKRVTELLGRVYDHNEHRNKLGYRMMTALWSNGNLSVPVCQALLTTRNPELMVGPEGDSTDLRTYEGRRRRLAQTKGTDVMVEFVKRAHKAGIPFDEVLADTWFSNPGQAIEIMKLGCRLIAMAKKSKTKYGLLPKEKQSQKNVSAEDLEFYDVKEIYSRCKKRRGTSKYLLSVNVWIKDDSGKLYPVKLVYARNHSNRKDWIAFLCTDPDLSEEEVLRRYCLRWNIEVYFHIEKSYLKLYDCHSTSYDALTARMVIAALRHMILTLCRFESEDNRTIEQLFGQVKREVAGYLVDTVMFTVLDILFESVQRVLKPTKDQMKELILDFFEHLPDLLQSKFDRSKIGELL